MIDTARQHAYQVVDIILIELYWTVCKTCAWRPATSPPARLVKRKGLIEAFPQWS